MPRESEVSRLTVVPGAALDARCEPLRPPPDLSPAVAAVFSEIVRSVGVGHFRPGDAPLLAQLANAVHASRQASAEIERNGLTVDGRPSPHLAVFERMSKLVASLSTKCRLTPASRMDRKVAGATTRTGQRSRAGAIDELLDSEGAK